MTHIRSGPSLITATLFATVALGILGGATAYAQVPASCPADPVARLQQIEDELNGLAEQMKGLKSTSPKEVSELLKVALKNGQPVSTAVLGLIEREAQLFDIDVIVTERLNEVLDINRCCFRSGKYIVWIEVETRTIRIKRTITVILKYQQIITKKFVKIKKKVQVLTTNVNCCECDGVVPPITGCASTVDLQSSQCDIACLPFNWTGGYFTSSQCSSASGMCIPDP